MNGIPEYVSGLLAILLLTAFVKMVTTLSILRYGLGLKGAGIGLVILAFSLVLSFFVVNARLGNGFGLETFLEGRLALTDTVLNEKFRPFLEKQTDKSVLDRMAGIEKRLRGEAQVTNAKSEQVNETLSKPSLSLLVSSFLISELKEAFKLGFLFIIPFLVIDLVVANALLALGVVQMPTQLIAVPLKIFLFLAVDGWILVSEKLIGTYVR